MAENNATTPVSDKTAVSVRIKIAGLWTSLLFVFVYVDIFGLFRADIINQVLAGKVHAFTVDQSFLLLTTIYITIPSMMIFLSLVLPPKINRRANILVAIVYAVTIAGSCIGETWLYYLFGSAVELLLLGLVIRYALKHPVS